MSRHFYILICIPLCFCYKFIETKQQLTNPKDNSEIRNVKHVKRNVVLFDVAGFLRNTATEKLQDYEPYGYANNDRHTQSDYYYQHPNENIKKRNENTNYFNIDTDSDSYDNNSKDEDRLINPQTTGEIVKNENILVSKNNKAMNTQNELLLDSDLLNPENKCAFKNMKVPFFSHKSTAKKRKLFCFHCSKRYAKDALPDVNPKINQLRNQLIKTYGNLCPKCIRKLLKHKKVPEKAKTIHNSREYYQNIAKNAKNNIPQNDYQTSTRLKRDDAEEEKRRLKELEEVERKVDNVEVTTPNFPPRIDGKA